MTRRRITTIAVILAGLLLTGAVVFYVRSHRDARVETTSKSPTAQSDYSGGKERDSEASGSSQGGAVDTEGEGVVPGEGGLSSDSGLVTVQQPLKSTVLHSGDALAGTTKGITKVQYRLIDEEIGVIAQGSLNVVNDAFSGKLQFKSKAATGRLDIFTYNNSGAEENNIEIPVRFN